MTITQLQQSIVALLSASPNLIGSYTLPNGNKVPAVYVVGRQSVPREWKVEGLEVTIQEFPRLSPRPGVGTLQQRRGWTVVLVDYDTSSDNFQKAAHRISRTWPDARLSFLPESDFAYRQYRIIIPDTGIEQLLRIP